jgi:ketosteroid isomerase-like protein
MKFIVGLTVIGILVAPSARAQTMTADQKEVMAVERALKTAVVNRDEPVLRQIYADEYLAIDSEGLVWTKEEDIAIDLNGVSRLTNYEFKDMNVRVFASVAVVTGRNLLIGTMNGVPATAEYRFTDVFVRRDGRWQCVTTQVTPVVAE